MACACHGVCMSWRVHVMACACHGVCMSWRVHVMACTCHGVYHLVMAWCVHVMVCTVMVCTCHGVHCYAMVCAVLSCHDVYTVMSWSKVCNSWVVSGVVLYLDRFYF